METNNDINIYRLLGSYQASGTTSYSTRGMLISLYINLVAFAVFMCIFEFNRSFKQIYLKRCIKRFIDAGRVPPIPPKYPFGWIFTLYKISELDVLKMVGLDAYMCLRYQYICLKLSFFLSFWGVLVLVPIYSSAAKSKEWQHYTIFNIANGPPDMKYRLWAATLFCYVFSAYFCQLLYAEYNNFSIKRLQYLVQTDPEQSTLRDPDTPQQKYYTVMIERIPPHLRSAEALYNFFNKLFPDDVYTVEVALDLNELNNLVEERKAIRDKLEKVIAAYEATNTRPKVYIQTGNITIFPDETTGLASESDSWMSSIQKLLAPEAYGFEPVDAISYYTARLQELNVKVKDMQDSTFESSQRTDNEMQEKFKNRYDTRAASLLESLRSKGTQSIRNLHAKNSRTPIEEYLFGKSTNKLPNRPTNRLPINPSNNLNNNLTKKKKRKGEFLVSLLFGGSNDSEDIDDRIVNDFNDEIDRQMKIISTLDVNSQLDKSIDKAVDRSIDRAHLPNRISTSINRQINKQLDKHTDKPLYNQIDNHIDNQIDNHIDNHIDNQTERHTDRHLVGSIDVLEDVTIDDSTSNILDKELVIREWRSQSIDPSDSYIDNKIVNQSVSQIDSQLDRKIDNQIDSKIDKQSSSSFGYITNYLMSQEQIDRINELARQSIETAKTASKQGWEQTIMAGSGAFRGVIEAERAFELLTLGAYYKYSSTAFVTFRSRVTESIAQQMLLSHDCMEIKQAPNPHDIIWNNVAIPRSQIKMRNFITNISLIVGSVFWSSLVSSIDTFASLINLPHSQQNLLAAGFMLGLLMVLPVIFDFISRYYEGIKLESEIQDILFQRYFFFQIMNVYVTVGFSSGDNSQSVKSTANPTEGTPKDILTQLYLILQSPHYLVTIIGRSIPYASLFFAELLILKIFSALPAELCRPYQLSTIITSTTCPCLMDRRQTTKRDLRTGVFFPWPMLYGWVYPQLLMVLIILLTYSCISPLLSLFGIPFFIFSYTMYKFQLLYTYISEYQSGGSMWYTLFDFSLISLLFATLTLLGYIALQYDTYYVGGPFWLLLPLPISVLYFLYYCHGKFKKQSMSLSLGFAKELDQRAFDRKQLNLSIPHDSFTKTMYRQPALTESPQYPEPYRNFMIHLDDVESNSDPNHRPNRRGTISIDIEELTHEGEDNESTLFTYFHDYVVPLASEGQAINNENDRDATINPLYENRQRR